MGRLRRHHKENKIFRYYKTLLVYISLIIIPVLFISLINFFTIRDQNYHILESNIQAESQKRMENFDQNIQDMSKVVSFYRTDKSFYKDYREEMPFNYLDIKKALSSTALWTSLYEQVYFYDVKNQAFISTKGVDSRTAFQKIYLKTEKDIDFSQFDHQAKSFLHIMDPDIRKSSIVIVVPFEKNYETGSAKSYFLFFVDDKIMQEAVFPDLAGKDSSVTLYYGEQPIISSSVEVNERISRGDYSDDGREREDTKNYVYSDKGVSLHWSIPKTIYNQSLFSLVVRQAVIAIVLISIVTALLLMFIQREYEPLMGILEKFPRQAGSKRLHQEFVHLDFALNDVLYSRNILQETNDELKKEKYLYMVLSNKIKRFSRLYSTVVDNQIHIDRERFACVMIQDKPSNMKTFLYVKEALMQEEKETTVYELYIAENRYIFLICTNLPAAALKKILKKISEEGDEKNGLVGVGSIVEEPDRIADSYRLAVYSSNHGDLLESSTKQDRLFPEVELEALLEGVTVENTAKIKASLKMIRENLMHYSEFTRMYLMVKITAIMNQEDEITAVRKFDTTESYSVGDVDAFLTQVYRSYQSDMQAVQREESISTGKNRKISRICRYIEENYMSPSFSIKGMADVFETSPSNLSHYFKKATGQTLSQYIDHVRIREAVKLLQSPENKVADIAVRIGYVNTSSFIEVFKKYMGTTPKSYQKQLLQPRQ